VSMLPIEEMNQHQDRVYLSILGALDSDVEDALGKLALLRAKLVVLGFDEDVREVDSINGVLKRQQVVITNQVYRPISDRSKKQY
jgi:hypothetical protein